MMKKPARLGEIQLPQSDHFPINRCPRDVLRGSKVQKARELREERKKKKEKETRLRHYRITTTIIPYFVSCFMFFVRPWVSFIFED